MAKASTDWNRTYSDDMFCDIVRTLLRASKFPWSPVQKMNLEDLGEEESWQDDTNAALQPG